VRHDGQEMKMDAADGDGSAEQEKP
jgi:hypothetical protein